MLWWRKRDEGFEWRDYVRTTILVRREQRRQRVKDVKEAAAAQVKEAGKRGLDASVAGVKKAGSGLGHGLGAFGRASAAGLGRAGRAIGSVAIRAGSAVGSGAVRAGRAAGSAGAGAAAGLWSAAASAARHIGAPAAPLLDPLLTYLREPMRKLALAAITALLGLGAAYRTWSFGFDTDATVAAVLFAVTAVLTLAVVLGDPDRRRATGARNSLLHRLGVQEFELPRTRISPRAAGIATVAGAAMLAVGAAVYVFAPSLPSLSQPEANAARPERDPSKLEGRAVAVTGDKLRVAGTLIVIDGIEAPEAGQSCQRQSGAWRCGTAAREALANLVRGRRITCDILSDDGERKEARCYVGGRDVAEAMVRNGHVFAEGGFLSRYASVEGEAEAEKLGLWAGEADRPQDYRDKRWEEAKKQAPEGCPIKGSIRSGARTYVLPWSPSYDGIRLRTSRGERWFCSESEAQAAGWSRSSES
ncbi:MAG: thermonuclease family protein [Hyphomicrobium sp.]